MGRRRTCVSADSNPKLVDADWRSGLGLWRAVLLPTRVRRRIGKRRDCRRDLPGAADERRAGRADLPDAREVEREAGGGDDLRGPGDVGEEGFIGRCWQGGYRGFLRAVATVCQGEQQPRERVEQLPP